MRPPLFLILLAILCSANLAVAQDSVRILSWNIQMLPAIVNNNGKAKRAKVIVEQLKTHHYDVVVFQELFKKRSRRIITKGLAMEFPYHTQVLNKKSIALKTNGGVMLFSRYPINEVHEIRYTNRTGFDRLSRKGALLAEMNVHGKTIQVVGTHLQAFGSTEIMYSQYNQLHNELLKPHTKPDVPQFICGDFNTIKSIPAVLPAGITQEIVNRLPRYPVMLQTLDVEDYDLLGNQQYTMDRPYNDLCKKRKEYRLLLDYVLVRSTNDISYSVSRRVKIMRHPWHKNHQDLSDHFAVEAIISGIQNPISTAKD